MRRPLTFAALALLLFGVEVATGAVSVAAIRVWTGFSVFLRGDELLVSGPRFVTGLVIALAGATLLGVVAWVEMVQSGVRFRRATCPRCGTATQRVRRLRRDRILAQIFEMNVTRRHCDRCGWSGLKA